MIASVREDELARVRWAATIKLNFLRAFSAGMVWAVAILVAPHGGATIAELCTIPLIASVGYVGVLPIFFLSAKVMKTFAGDAGEFGVRLLTLACGIAIAVGDPLVYLLHQKRPAWVPVDRFRPLNVTMVVYVMGPAEQPLKGE